MSATFAALALALPRQPLVERGKIDHHALMGAAADLFGFVVRRDLEFDSLALNLAVRHRAAFNST